MKRVEDIHNVPLATNLTIAEDVLHLMAEHPEVLDGKKTELLIGAI